MTGWPALLDAINEGLTSWHQAGELAASASSGSLAAIPA
jgi:hypothetical protein